MTATGSATRTIAAAPDAVFAALTDVGRLPEWNARMTSVVEQPAALTDGAEWVVAFAVLGRRWRSRSTVEQLDVAARRFRHRSRTDDGNPSYAEWDWRVDPDPADPAANSRVNVSWTLHPATFWRRVLLARIRARQLAHTEVPASLAALSTLVSAPARR